jgi:hypothetical protein
MFTENTPEVTEAPATFAVEAPKPKARKPRPKAHKYIAVNRLERPIGIEVSYIPQGAREKEDHGALGEMVEPLARMLGRRLDRAKVPYNRCGTDPDCVEVSTKVMRTRNNLRRTLGAYYTYAEEIGLTGCNEWHGGGGAHIHVSRKPEEKSVPQSKFLTALYADLSNRPYIGWAFMNPGDDNCNASAISTVVADYGCAPGAKLRQAVEEAEANVKAWQDTFTKQAGTGESRDDREYASASIVRARRKLLTARKALAAYKPASAAEHNAQVFNRVRFGKGAAVSMRDSIGKHGTLEFRFFRAPGSVEGHEAQVNFAMAYIEYCEGLARDGKAPAACVDNIHTLRKTWTREAAEKGFRKTLRLIGLPVSDYYEDIDNLHRYFDITEAKYKTVAKAERVDRIDPYTLAENQNASRKRRAERKARWARMRAFKARGISAYIYHDELAISVGDTLTHIGQHDSRLRTTKITGRVGGTGLVMRDEFSCYWSEDGTKNDERRTLLAWNGIPVISRPAEEVPPVMYPETLTECEGAYIDKESVCVPGSFRLKAGDIVVMARRVNRVTAVGGVRETMIVRTATHDGERGAALDNHTGERHWGSGYADPHTWIWDSGAWIVEVNGRPVEGR